MIKQTGINIDNIIRIKCIPTQEFTKNVSFFTANCRSALKSGRDTQVRNFMIEKDIDFGVLTETWFQDATENWKLCDMNIHPLKLDTINRSEGKRGGGIALVFKQYLKVSKISSPSLSLKSFEHGSWKIHNRNCNLTVLGIYHPPANKKANKQEAVFVKELINLLTDLLLNHSHIIIMGDFNMHCNKPEDPNVSILE